MSRRGPIRLRRAWRRLTLPHRRRLPGGRVGLQVVRRIVQLAVLSLLIAIPVLSVYENLRQQGDDVGIQARWDTRLVHDLVGDAADPAAVTTALTGSVWTFQAGGVTLSDPLAGVDFAAASHVVLDPFLWSILLPVVFTLLLGRVFCGWICPADLLFEAGSALRRWARIDTDVTFARSTKFAALALGVVAAAVAGTQVFAEIYPPRLVSEEIYLWVSLGVFGAGAWFLLLMVTFEVFVSRRFWCRYVCPGGALYALLGRWRVVRLEVDDDSCTRCKLCNRACEFGLEPMDGDFGSECNNCGLCVRACASRSLSYRLRLGRPRGRGEETEEASR